MVSEIVPDVNYVLCDMITKMFGHTFVSNQQNLHPVSIPPADKYMVYIQLRGVTVEGELILSFNGEAATHFLDTIQIYTQNEITQRKLLHSTLGEIANVVAGEIMTHDCFKKTFGEVRISPPLVWDAEAPTEGCIPLRSGFAGSVENGDDAIKTFVTCSQSNMTIINEIDYTGQNIKVS
ncbi:MAG: chemotaxis protein CheX [Lentisphaeraceae bacterium]|nr:chemotaxis protein CheX [Lentisphaeraceae bacterium]